MQKHISFHGHEAVSAEITKKRLKHLGFTSSEVSSVVKLVLLHGTKFYEETKDSTIRKFLRKLGKHNLRRFINLVKANRLAGAITVEAEKPLTNFSSFMINLKVLGLHSDTIFIEDLAINKIELILLGIPEEKAEDILVEIAHVVQTRPEKNNKPYLFKYLEKNYLGKKNVTRSLIGPSTN